MKYNDFTYCLVHESQFDERDGLGYPDSGTSDDGKWKIGDKNDQDTHDWIDFDISIVPQYMKDLGLTECCFDHGLANKIKCSPEWITPTAERE